MKQENDMITMLGTGNALATRCYNTCFTLHGKSGILLVDAGGGNGILTQLERAGIRREDIEHFDMDELTSIRQNKRTL